MRFARLVAAFILLASVLTPLRLLLRSWCGTGTEASGLAELALYAAVLAGVWIVSGGLALLVRTWLKVTDQWQGSGLAALEERWGGPALGNWALILGLVAVVAAIFQKKADRWPSVVEAILAAAAAFLAVASPPRGSIQPEEFDPLPQMPEPEPLEPEAPHPVPEPVPVPEPEPVPVPGPGPSPGLSPAPEPSPGPSPPPGVRPGGDLIPITMSWYFKRDPTDSDAARDYRIDLEASRQRYDEASARPRELNVKCWHCYVRDGTTPEVQETARRLRDFSARDRFGSIAEINLVLAFVQGFVYADDIEKGMAEYPKYPIETIVDLRGDCEDHAILGVACLRRLGYDARLVELPGHVALAVAAPQDIPGGGYLMDRSGRKFYFCEVTTEEGRDPDARTCRLGFVPPGDNKEMVLLDVLGG